MPYASRADIEAVYGAQLLQIVADLTNDGVPEDTAITAAIGEASSEIDSYIGTKYPVPMLPVPLILVKYCRDIAIYNLAGVSGAPRTTEMRRRYEDAIAFLEKVATGKITLIAVPGDLDGDGDVDEDDAALAAELRQSPYVVRVVRGN